MFGDLWDLRGQQLQKWLTPGTEFLNIYFFCLILCVCVPECVSVHHMCSGTWEVRRVRDTGTRVNDNCELPCKCWEPKPDPLHEQPASTPNCWTTAPPVAWDLFLLDMYSFLFGPYLYRRRIAGTYDNSNFWGKAKFFSTFVSSDTLISGI